MEVVEKKNKNKQYKPILEGIPDWPVYQLSKNRKEFIEEVAQKTFAQIKKTRPTAKHVIDEIQATVYREQQRMKRNRWRVDALDEPKFWANVKDEVVSLATKPPEESLAKADDLLYRIIHRYANEIAGSFKASSYRVTREIVKFWFSRLLNGARVKKFGAFFRNRYTLRDKIHIMESLFFVGGVFDCFRVKLDLLPFPFFQLVHQFICVIN